MRHIVDCSGVAKPGAYWVRAGMIADRPCCALAAERLELARLSLGWAMTKLQRVGSSLAMKPILQNAALIGPVLVAGMWCATPADASTTTAIMDVTANLATSCQASIATSLSFGVIEMGSGDVDGRGVVAVTCSDGAPYTVSANLGLNPSGSVRRMRHKTQSIFSSYDLYANLERTVSFPTSSTDPIVSIGTGFVQNIGIYGRMQRSSNVVPGEFDDVVTIYVDY